MCGKVEGEQKEKLLLKKREHFQFALDIQNTWKKGIKTSKF